MPCQDEQASPKGQHHGQPGEGRVYGNGLWEKPQRLMGGAVLIVRYWRHAEAPLSFAAGATADDVDDL